MKYNAVNRVTRKRLNKKASHTMTTKMLRPGLLVSLSARISGGVVYDRKDLEAGDAMKRFVSDKAAVSKWETTKVIEDPAEYERAVKIRGQVRNLIASVCARSDFGLLCPASREFDLQRAIEESKRVAAEHNASARRSFVSVYVISGRIAQDDAEAARAVASEVRGLIDEMERGIKGADVETIRKAANAAKSLGAMLTDDASAKLTDAISQARAAAREIVKRVEKSGEEMAKVVSEVKLDALSTARFAFLDLDGSKPVESAPVAAASLDLAPIAAPEPSPAAKPAAVPAIEII